MKTAAGKFGSYVHLDFSLADLVGSDGKSFSFKNAQGFELTLTRQEQKTFSFNHLAF